VAFDARRIATAHATAIPVPSAAWTFIRAATSTRHSMCIFHGLEQRLRHGAQRQSKEKLRWIFREENFCD
jgi:hypothetical protein